MFACLGLALLMSWAKHYARAQAAKRAADLEYGRMRYQAQRNAEAMAEVALRMRALP